MKSTPTVTALAAALLGAGALHVYLTRYELEVAGGEPKPVVIATRDIGLGEVITRASLDLRELPERYLEERHIEEVDLERIVGTRATTAIASGASLLWTDLDVSPAGRTLSGLVRGGMRAFTLPQSDVSFDGLLRPGDRVDVLFTPAEPSARTTTLIENAIVLTVGGDLGDGQEDGERPDGGRVTLSVRVEQAQLLAHSEQRGALHLALRNPQDLVVAEGAEASEASRSSRGAP